MLIVGILCGVVAVLISRDDSSARKAPPCKYIKKICKQAGYDFSPGDRPEALEACFLPIVNSGKFGDLMIDSNVVAKCKIRLDRKKSKTSKKAKAAAGLKKKKDD